MFFKRLVIKDFAKSTGKDQWQSVFNKATGLQVPLNFSLCYQTYIFFTRQEKHQTCVIIRHKFSLRFRVVVIYNIFIQGETTIV